MELFNLTIKTIKLAIDKYIPYLENLHSNNLFDTNVIDKINDLLDMYNDIYNEIAKYNLNINDLNKHYNNEPSKIKTKITGKYMKHLTSLVLRLLTDLKEEKNEIEIKEYLSEKNEKKLEKLKNDIQILEYQFQNSSTLFSKNKDLGPMKFPGENHTTEKTNKINHEDETIIFPLELMGKLNTDIKVLCEEFNFNYKNGQNNACILLLRRILPLSIVRFFQSINEENVLKDKGEYLDTKGLLGKIENKLSSKRIYKEVMNYKFIIDSSQHLYTLNSSREDAQGSSIAIRVLLNDIFHSG